MAFTGPLEDRMAIRDFYGHFSYVSCSENLEQWLACWTEDCQWKTDYFSVHGKSEVREQWDVLWTNFDKVILLSELGSMVVDGDKASVDCIMRELVQLKDGSVMKLAGIYRDTLIKQNNSWRFSSRNFQISIEENR